jgi:hypothetical protein
MDVGEQLSLQHRGLQEDDMAQEFEADSGVNLSDTGQGQGREDSLANLFDLEVEFWQESEFRPALMQQHQAFMAWPELDTSTALGHPPQQQTEQQLPQQEGNSDGPTATNLGDAAAFASYQAGFRSQRQAQGLLAEMVGKQTVIHDYVLSACVAGASQRAFCLYRFDLSRLGNSVDPLCVTCLCERRTCLETPVSLATWWKISRLTQQ